MLLVTIPGVVRTRYGVCELEGPCSARGAANAATAPRNATDTTNPISTDLLFIDECSPSEVEVLLGSESTA
jgi:hypothetical protein